jgi:hypothetical protein
MDSPRASGPAVIDLGGGVSAARQRLDQAASRLEQDQVSFRDVEGPLSAGLALLEEIRREAERAAVSSISLARLEAKAAENIDLAGLALERDERGSAAEGMSSLQAALFHAQRALDYLQTFLDEMTESTRAVDRERNRQEFMSG